MAAMLITCPETAHLEHIDYERDPLGMLIRRCSAFRDGCPMTCPRTCAARLDRRVKAKVGTILVARSCWR